MDPIPSATARTYSLPQTSANHEEEKKPLPAEIHPGEEIPNGIVIRGKGLEKIKRIELEAPAGENPSASWYVFSNITNTCKNVIAVSRTGRDGEGEFLVTQPLEVVDGAIPGLYRLNFYDRNTEREDERTLLSSLPLKVRPLPVNPEVVGYIIPFWRSKEYFDLRTSLQGGPAIPVGDDNLHPLARASQDQAPPTYRLDLAGKLPIIGRPAPFVSNQFQLDFRENLAFEQHVHLEGKPDTLRVETSPELDFSAAIVPYVTPDLKVRCSLSYNDEAYPNRRFFSGTTYRLNPELGLKLDRIWKEKLPWLSARPFASYQHDRMDYEKETGFGSFVGVDHTGKAGAQAELRLRSDIPDSKAGIPDIALSGYYLWGTHEAPEIYQNLLLKNSEEARSGFGLDGNFQWRARIPYVQITNPAIRLVYERESLEGWDDTQRFSSDLSAEDISRSGTWQLGFLYDQLDPYYGTEQTSGRLSWRPPVRWHFGKNGWLPANAFSASLTLDHFSHPEIFGQEGSQTSINTLVGFEPLQFFFPGKPRI